MISENISLTFDDFRDHKKLTQKLFKVYKPSYHYPISLANNGATTTLILGISNSCYILPSKSLLFLHTFRDLWHETPQTLEVKNSLYSYYKKVTN